MLAKRFGLLGPFPQTGLRFTSVCGVLLGASLALLPACTSPQRAAGGTSAEVPEEGTVVFYDPARQGNVVKTRQHTALTRVFTTADDELAEESSEVQVLTGAVPYGTGEDDASRRQLAQQLYEASRKKGSVRFLPKDQFAVLWKSLGAAGLFKIPPSRLTAPPKDRSYFHIQADDREWIITRPRLKDLNPESASTKHREYWSSAKVALVQFENSL